MDAIELLSADHQKVLEMFDRLEQGPSVLTGANEQQLRERGELVTELIIMECQHEAVEEQFFWPTVRATLSNGDAIAAHAITQEQDAKRVLEDLEWARPDQAKFEKSVEMVITAGRRHIAYEETDVWPLLRAALTTDQLMELGQKMAAAKPSAPTRPHPHTPPTPLMQKAVGSVASAIDAVVDNLTGHRHD